MICSYSQWARCPIKPGICVKKRALEFFLINVAYYKSKPFPILDSLLISIPLRIFKELPIFFKNPQIIVNSWPCNLVCSRLNQLKIPLLSLYASLARGQNSELLRNYYGVYYDLLGKIYGVGSRLIGRFLN